MHDLSSCVSHNTLIRGIRDLLPGETYLVGGSVRDLLLGREPDDFDLVTAGPVEDIARGIAQRLGSRPFWMDEKRGVMRIVVKSSGIRIDIARPKGETIRSDLMARDLTINAMACDLSTGTILDPSGGMDDLKNGVIRLISEGNLIDDPLRALRAVRFSVTLGFALHEETSRMIRRHGRLLSQVALERIRLEFARSLSVPHSAKFFRLLTWEGLIPVLFPRTLIGDAQGHQLWHPVFMKALPLSEETDEIIWAAEALMPGSRAYLGAETEGEVPRASMLRLAAFLVGLKAAGLTGGHAGGEEDSNGLEDFAAKASDFCSLLRFSSLSAKMVRGAIARLDLTDTLLSKPEASPLELYRFCEETAEVLPEALILSLAGRQKPDRVRRQNASMAWEYYLRVYREYKDHPLVTGRDVMQATGGSPGPRVGSLLLKVEEARAQGIVKTRSEALEYLQSIAS